MAGPGCTNLLTRPSMRRAIRRTAALVGITAVVCLVAAACGGTAEPTGPLTAPPAVQLDSQHTSFTVTAVGRYRIDYALTGQGQQCGLKASFHHADDSSPPANQPSFLVPPSLPAPRTGAVDLLFDTRGSWRVMVEESACPWRLTLTYASPGGSG